MASATVYRKDLKTALSVMRLVNGGKSSIPALAGVLVDADKDVRVSATNLETWVSLTLERQHPGGKMRALIPGGLLRGFVDMEDAATLSMELVSDKTVKLNDGLKVSTMDPGDYPTDHDKPKTLFATIPAGELAAALGLLKVNVSTEVVRYSLSGVLLDLTKDGIHLVASDGKRLGWYALEGGTVHVRARLNVRMTLVTMLEELGRRAPDVLVKVFADKPKVTAAPGKPKAKGKPKPAATGEPFSELEGDVFFELPAATCHSRLIEGRFPDYALTVPSYKTKVSVGVKALVKGLKQVCLATTDKTRAVKFTLQDSKCALLTRTQDVGAATFDLPVTGAMDTTFVLNPDFVLDYLGSLPKEVETVELYADGPEAAVLWKGPKGFQWVCMPLKLIL